MSDNTFTIFRLNQISMTFLMTSFSFLLMLTFIKYLWCNRFTMLLSLWCVRHTSSSLKRNFTGWHSFHHSMLINCLCKPFFCIVFIHHTKLINFFDLKPLRNELWGIILGFDKYCIPRLVFYFIIYILIALLIISLNWPLDLLLFIIMGIKFIILFIIWTRYYIFVIWRLYGNGITTVLRFWIIRKWWEYMLLTIFFFRLMVFFLFIFFFVIS